VEHDFGGNDGVEGDIDVPIPISKGVAYRFPFSGKVYAFWDNVTVTYGQNLSPVDPFASLFEYQKHRDPGLSIPRRRREVSYSKKVWSREPTSATYEEHLKTNGKNRLSPCEDDVEIVDSRGAEFMQSSLLDGQIPIDNDWRNELSGRQMLFDPFFMTPVFPRLPWFSSDPWESPAELLNGDEPFFEGSVFL
ncbi:unnamed protein product, partial [Heligmosomoides polygyrus]|uniref:DM13 domain-containing protein n=1 Tax=Heligmosomoides polygyrus TaxID=6339 RepID=A0A183GV21_HELPZ